MSGHRITAKGKQWKAPLFFFAVFLCAFLSAQGGRTAAAKAQEETGLCNVVVFLRFQGESEFLSGTPQVPSILQKDGTTVNLADSYRDVDHYFQKISDGACPVDTLFLTADPSGQTAASYEVPHPRSYYLPYSASNPQGVPSSGNERFNREMDLLENALKAVLASLPENISLDRDGDGKIDNITFLACGSPSASSQVIWPHRWALQKNKITAADSSGEEKLAYDYNFTFADSRYSGVGVLCHELLHTLGFPDLYREGDKTGGVPVGGWDVMGSEDKDNPQYPCAYLSKAYGGWGRIEEISGSGLYTLRPLGTDDGSPDAYAIPTEDPNEFLMAEYRKNSPGIQGDNVPRDGLLLYRVNRLTSSGNIHGSPAGGDEVYVYRPGDASPNAGTQRRLSEAALGSQWGVSSYGSASPSAPAVETLYLSSGENTGIVISRVSEQEDGTLTFHVALPEDENRIEPGSYDLSLRDYTIAEPGEYRFTGSTSEHSVTVTGKARDVSIILENVEIDLREKENSSPILLRAGTQASLQTEGNCLLQGGANAPAVRVREGASLTVSGPGSLTVSGGAGAAAIGGNTQETAGSLAFSGADVTAVGGGAYQQQGIAALLETGPAPAIGAGADGRCGDIRLENTKLRGRSGSGAAVSTGLPGKTPGGSLTVSGGGIWGDGGLCGGSLSCENAVISISRSARSDFGCLEAENSIALHGCEVEIESMAGGSAVGSRSRKPQVEISGGSFRAFSKDCTICASSAALGEDTRFSLGTQEEEILYVGENAEGKPYEAQPGIAQGASGRAVLLQGTLEAPLPGEDELRLMGESVEKTAHPLPSGCRTGAFSAPLETEFYLQNRSGERSQFLRVTRDGITRIPLEFSRQDSPYRELDLSSRSVTVTESGEYRVHGAFSERSITVEAGLQVTLHLEGLTLTAPSDTAAVSAKAGSDLTLVLESPWENELSGGTGKPALDVDGSLAITGSGALSALGGKGAAAISAGTVALGPDSRLFAAGGGSSAVLRREAAEEDGWNLPGKPAPRLLMGGLQRSFSGATELFFRGGEELERYLVPSGTKSFFVTVSGSAPRTLIANTSAASPALDCTAGVNSYENVAFTSWSTSARSVDLSQGDVEITENGTYRISGSTSRYTVTVADEVVATLILDGAQIRVTQAEFLEGKRGLIELGENTLATLSFPSFGQASALANRVPESTCGIVYVPRSSRLTVNGSQTLAVMPGEEAMLFGARDGEEAGAVTLRSGEIDCGLSPGSTSQTLLGGRHSRVSLESGSLTVTGGPCGAVGGDSSRVSLSGGSLTLSGGSPSGTVGGAGALVTVTGGVLSLDLKSGCIGLGGSSSVVDIRGGEMTVSDVSNVSGGMLAGLGGSHSLLRLDGGSVQIDSLRKSGSGGALGGENARMELSAQGKLAVRLKQRSNAPLAGNVQENFSASGGLLDVRLASAFSSGSRVLLRNRETDEITAEVFLPPSYYGFFLPLPSGVYDLLTPSGACGGSVEIQPGKIASLENVRFDRLAGVWLADGEAEYDGTPHSLSLSGSLPEDASVSYEGNGAIEPGEYPVTASISADGISYTLTATLTVKKAPLTATGVFPADKPVYDGSCETGGTLSLSGAKGEDTPEATARFRFADPDVGTAKPVLVSDIVLLPEWDSRYELVIPEDVLSGAAASVLEKAEAKVTLHRKGSGFAVSTVPAGLSCPITYGGETEPPSPPACTPSPPWWKTKTMPAPPRMFWP